MTMIIDASVKVCFMMAKLSSKYVKSGLSAVAASIFGGAAVIDKGRPCTFCRYPPAKLRTELMLIP